MSSSFRYYWEALRTSYWFIPAILGVCAILLSLITVGIDHEIAKHSAWNVPWTYTGGPEGARAVLATIAGSMITVAGVVFSITIVALSLASAQFGPRLLRNFIRDRRNQFVLGTFTATFLYCLLILRTVRGMDEVQFVPGVSVSVGLSLAVVNLGILIYFIHHVAIAIQANSVIQSVSDELRETIDRLWPEKLGEEPPRDVETSLDSYSPATATPVPADSSGYVDAIDNDSLLKLAQEQNLVVRLAYRPGRFAVKDTPLAWIWPAQRVNDDTAKRLNRAFTLAGQRTPFQDVEFAIDQLVEVAVRALSPGVNDPFTALNCIDRLGEALCRLARRSSPSPLRYDDQNNLRVITYPADFRAVANAAFNQIRQYGGGSAAVLICLLETLEIVVSFTRRDDDREAIAHHAELAIRAARRGIEEPDDLADVEQRFQNFQKQLSPRSEAAREA